MWTDKDTKLFHIWSVLEKGKDLLKFISWVVFGFQMSDLISYFIGGGGEPLDAGRGQG